MPLFRPGTIRAMARGFAGRRGRSIRSNARIYTLLIIIGFAVVACLTTL